MTLMKRIYPTFAFFAAIVAAALTVASCGNPDRGAKATADSASTGGGVPQLSAGDIDDVLASMTLEEKAAILVGGAYNDSQDTARGPRSLIMGDEAAGRVPGAGGHTARIRRLGIPSIIVSDGPAGLRINPTREGTDKTFYCTAFPVGVLLSSTWDTGLIEQVGGAMGNEVLEYGVDVLLAPAMNIMRNQLCGRNFEYYSEDPLLAGKVAAAMIRGIQSNGVGTSLKHFAVNNQETNRANLDARVSDRALREIYLRGFEIAVKEGRPWTVMSANNKLNGVFTSESRYLLTDILRDEWGFDGAVMTDWLSGYDAGRQIHAGNDLLMPGIPFQRDSIVAAVKAGKLSVQDLDTDVRRILALVAKSPTFRGHAYSDRPDKEAHARVTRQSASEGMVLLKNDGALPLQGGSGTLALFGNTSYEFISGGTGSGDVNSAYTVSLREGLANNGYKLAPDLEKAYMRYLSDGDGDGDKASPLAALPNVKLREEMDIDAALARQAVAQSDAAIFTIGRISGEGHDRNEVDDFLLTEAERRAMTLVSDCAKEAGKPFVVVLNVGGVVETASWKDGADAILLAWQGGQEGGNSVSDILCGKVNPSGKLPMTFPVSLSDVASNANFPQDCNDFHITFSPLANNIEMLRLMGVGSEPDLGRKDIDFTDYEEGIWVGYRDFEHFGKPVSYPFGYGLSYTTFDYGQPTVRKRKDGYTVSVTVTNSGAVAGKEVVELYVSAPEGGMEKPEQELKAFAKTRLLKPGESQAVELSFTDYDLASFDEGRRAWVTDKGDYEIRLAASSRDVRGTASLKVKKGRSWPVTKIVGNE